MKFFKENKRRAAVIILILALSITVISFITSLVESIIVDAFNANLKPFEHFSAVYRNSSDIFLRDEVVQKIEALPQTRKTLAVFVDNTMYQSLMGNTSSPILFFENEEDIQEVLNLNNLTLTAGRLPAANTYELILHENLLKNKDLSLGDYIGSDVQDDEWLQGRYKIVGTVTGEALIGFGRTSYSAAAYASAGLTLDKPTALLIFPKTGQLETLNAELDKIDKKQANVTTYSSLNETLNKQAVSMKAILSIVIFVVVLALSLSVGGLTYVVYMGRTDEFGILFAMGYRKGFINTLIIKELAALVAFCWLTGYIFAMGVTYLVNALLLSPKGQVLYFFIPDVVTNTLLVPLMVLVCTVLPVLRKFKKWDPIAIIERRD